MVDDPAACRRLLYAANEVHEHRFASAAPADNSKDLSFGNLKGNIPEDLRAVKIHAEVLDRDQWSFHNTLVPNVIQVSYYLLLFLRRSQL